ncbi:MAG: hypothetical protein ACTJG2_03025 [Candidatus Saccharimonadales bacterium]
MPQTARKTSASKKVSKKNEELHHSSAGLIVLQWLTYAFWGWLIVGLLWLLSVILMNALLDEPVADVVPYAIAASVVALPLAFVTDLFYRKHEPLKKVGGSAVVMIIHAVLYALLGIGSLIITVFMAIDLAVGTGDNTEKSITLFVGLFATLAYAAAFLRTLNPFKTAWPLRAYGYGMLAVTLALLVLTITGPLTKSIATRDDRRIEENIVNVQLAIDEYVAQHHELPSSLDTLAFDPWYAKETKQLINDKLITYQKEERVIEQSDDTATAQHRYQLCVEYTHARKDATPESDTYGSIINIDTHEAGAVCYKLQSEDWDADSFDSAL